MPIFDFEAHDLSHTAWQASSYKGPCRVHAPNEDTAREYANNEFTKAAKRQGAHAKTQLSPWMNPRFSRLLVTAGGPSGEYLEGQIETLKPGKAREILSAPAWAQTIHDGEQEWNVIKIGKPLTQAKEAIKSPRAAVMDAPAPSDDAANIAVHGRSQVEAEFAATSGTSDTSAPTVELDVVMGAKAGLGVEAEVIRAPRITRQTVARLVVNREALIIQAKVFSNLVDQQLTPAAFPSNAPPAPLWTEDAEDPEALNELLRGVQDRLDRLIVLLEVAEVDLKKLAPLLSDLRKVIMAFLIPAAGVAGIGVGGMVVTTLAQYAVELGLMDWPKFVEVFKNLPRK